jgi:hypothetical protein
MNEASGLKNGKIRWVLITAVNSASESTGILFSCQEFSF